MPKRTPSYMPVQAERLLPTDAAPAYLLIAPIQLPGTVPQRRDSAWASAAAGLRDWAAHSGKGDW